MMYFVGFIIVITLVVFVHEFAHYYVARKLGVKVEEFSIGFGKEILGWYDKNYTRWKICFIPLGGYVKMFGDANIASEENLQKISKLTEHEKKIAFYTQKLLHKAAIVIAGPLSNFILTIIILTSIFFCIGKPYAPAIIEDVQESSRADKVGLKKGDYIIQIDDTKIEDAIDIQKYILSNKGEEIEIKITRENRTLLFNLSPEVKEETNIYGEKVKVPRIGILLPKEVLRKKYDLLLSLKMAIKETYDMTTMILSFMKNLVTKGEGINQLSGPIKIVEYSGKSLEAGFTAIFYLIAIVSLNLGIFNLFPIPMLDGGHLAFYTIEAITKKPVNAKVIEYSYKLGAILLIALTMTAISNDIISLIN